MYANVAADPRLEVPSSPDLTVIVFRLHGADDAAGSHCRRGSTAPSESCCRAPASKGASICGSCLLAPTHPDRVAEALDIISAAIDATRHPPRRNAPVEEASMSDILQIADPAASRTAPSLWRAGLGFRPFFLLGAAHAAAVVALWVGTLSGWWAVGDLGWHAREMTYGFGGAIVAGFLLTAVPNWTASAPIVGPWLAALVALWCAARLAALDGPGWGTTALVSGFLVALAGSIAVPIVRARAPRNYGVPVVVLALAVSAVIEQLGAQGVALPFAMPPPMCGVLVIVLLMAVVGGRVIPFFTRSRLGDAVGVPPPRPLLEVLSLGLLALAVPATWWMPDSTALGVLFLAAGVLHGLRLARWAAPPVWRVPMLAILYAGYLWLAGGLVLAGLAVIWPAVVAPTLALHALTAGAMGSLILGMIARVSRGHTGRSITADRVTVGLFIAVTLSALLRVVAPLLTSASYVTLLGLSAAAWALAFGGFVVRYAPILMTPRPDGKAG